MAQETVTQATFHLPIRNRRDLRFYLRAVWGIRLPDVSVCEGHSNPWDAFCDVYFGNAPAVVWEGSRGFAGKSFTMATLGLACAHGRGAFVNILGGSLEQAQRVLEASDAAWQSENAPVSSLVGETGRVTRFKSGAKLQVLAASTKSVRGPHPQYLLVDEVDEVDLPVLDAALGQSMSKPSAIDGHVIPGVTLLSSTHQYPDGTMTEVKRRAKANGWPHHSWCYRETLVGASKRGWLVPEEVDRKRAIIPAAMWEAEYELQEPNPTGRAIMPEAVKAMFRRELGYHPSGESEIVTEAPTGGRYATGADWARKTDRTAILTLRHDCKPMRFVAFQAFNRRPWPLMVGAFEDRLKRYGKNAAHDGTGLGDVVDGFMRTKCESVMLVGRERQDVFSEFVAAIERGEIASPFFELMEGEYRYCSVDDLYGSGHPPDTFVAGALAYRAATKGRRAAFAVA